MVKSFCKIGVMALVLIVAAPFFVGCADFFFERVHSIDMSQVVATVNIPPQTRDGESQPFVEGRIIEIRKISLVQEVNQIGADLVQQGMSAQEAVEHSLEAVINREVVAANIAIELERHNLWLPDIVENSAVVGTDYYNFNNVLRSIYNALHQEIIRVSNEILQERGEDTLPGGEGGDPPLPPHPVPPTPEPDRLPEERWKSDYFPGRDGDDWRQSLERAAFRRVINSFGNFVRDDFRLSDNQRNALNSQMHEIRQLIEIADTEGETYQDAYLQLGIDFFEEGENSLLYLVIGQQVLRQSQREVFDDWLRDDADGRIQETAIQQRYNFIYAQQRVQFVNTQAFVDAANAGNLILHHPHNNYYWVKHILLPFSAEQTAFLTSLRQGGSSSIEAYELSRNNLANAISVHPRVDGFEVGQSMSPQQVMAEVQSVMAGTEGDSFEANRRFDQLIFRFNTDPGMFQSLDRGYIVRPQSNSDPALDQVDPQFVPEFGRAARELRRAFDEREQQIFDNPGLGLNSRIGMVSDMVVTDFGVHIMYLANVQTNLTLQLNDWTNPTQTVRVREAIREVLIDEEMTVAFEEWQSTIILATIHNNLIVRYPQRFSNLF